MSFDPSLPDDAVNVSPTHPLREALLLVGGGLAAVALLVAGVALSVDLLIPRLPVGLEVRLFSKTWGAGLGAIGREAAADPQTEALEALVDRLAQHWPENPYAFRVIVLDEEEVNAIALPGGWIAVTDGLLDGAASENELAFVLGHEIGHFRNRDHLRGLGRGVALGLVLAAADASGSGAAAQLAALTAQLAQRGFDRDQETAADVFGLAIVAAEYGHLGGATDFFGRAPDPASQRAGPLADYLATHPVHADREGALRRLAEERGWPQEGPRTPLPRD